MIRRCALILACLVPVARAPADLWVTFWDDSAGNQFYLASPVDGSLELIGVGSPPPPSTEQIIGLDFASSDVLLGATIANLVQIDTSSLAIEELSTIGGQALGSAVAVAPDGDFIAAFQIDLFGPGTNILLIDPESFNTTDSTAVAINTLAADFRSDGVLVGIENEANDLWTMDPFTGDLGFIGHIDGIEGIVSDMAASPHGDAWVITAESVGDETINRLYELDPFTGDASLVGVFDVPPDQVVGGIAYIPAPPAAGAVLLGLALATHLRRTR